MKTETALLRLRAANPVALTDDAFDEALFERITAVPRDIRTSRGFRRPIVVFALALIALAVLASTAFAISQWLGGDVVKPDVTLAEYRAAQHELQVPPGFEWPKLRVDPDSMTTRGGGGGYAVLNAEIAWDCYWVDAIRRHDAAAQQRAHRQLSALMRRNILVAPVGAPEGWYPAHPPKAPFAVFAHDGGYEWLQQAVTLAGAGHPDRLAQRCVANR